MKNKSILLVLPALALICSCSSEPGSDYKEIDATTAKAQAKQIETNVESKSFTLPNKVTYTFSSSASGKDKNGNTGANLKGSSSLDLENKYVHFCLEGDAFGENGGSGKMEGWSYIKDNQFVAAIESGATKAYSLVSIEGGEQEFDSFVKKANLNSDTLIGMAKEFADEIADYASAKLDITIGTAGIKSESKFFKGSGDGDLKLEYKQSFESSSYSYNEEGKFVLGSYLPTYFYYKKTGNFDGAAFQSESKFQFDWGKCDLNYPNLDSFTLNASAL